MNDFRKTPVFTVDQATQFAQGYIELPPAEMEEYKKKFHSVEKDGKILFPFYYIPNSLLDRSYIMFSKAKEKRKYTKRKTAEQQPEDPSK